MEQVSPAVLRGCLRDACVVRTHEPIVPSHALEVHARQRSAAWKHRSVGSCGSDTFEATPRTPVASLKVVLINEVLSQPLPSGTRYRSLFRFYLWAPRG